MHHINKSRLRIDVHEMLFIHIIRSRLDTTNPVRTRDHCLRSHNHEMVQRWNGPLPTPMLVCAPNLCRRNQRANTIMEVRSNEVDDVTIGIRHTLKILRFAWPTGIVGLGEGIYSENAPIALKFCAIAFNNRLFSLLPNIRPDHSPNPKNVIRFSSRQYTVCLHLFGRHVKSTYWH